MGTKMNEEQYRKMIALDIEFLKQLPDTLERKHIVSILKESVEMYYSIEGNQANSKPANCAIFDVMQRAFYAGRERIKHPDWDFIYDDFEDYWKEQGHNVNNMG
jgi:hypothetical protein